MKSWQRRTPATMEVAENLSFWNREAHAAMLPLQSTWGSSLSSKLPAVAFTPVMKSAFLIVAALVCSELFFAEGMPNLSWEEEPNLHLPGWLRPHKCPKHEEYRGDSSTCGEKNCLQLITGPPVACSFDLAYRCWCKGGYYRNPKRKLGQVDASFKQRGKAIGGIHVTSSARGASG
uniref:Uncharacterized protein n=1 Tax=Amblyomma maculatum TaxID=34609 RepID=G3MTT3_AMBMU